MQISKSVKLYHCEAFYTFASHRGGGFESQCFPGLWHWTTGEGKNLTNLREWHVVQEKFTGKHLNAMTVGNPLQANITLPDI